MKRAATGSLTGGTGDVNPQWMKISTTQSGADTFTQTTNPIPVQRLPTSGRAQVMEILKILFYSDAARAEVDSTVQAFLTTKSYSTAPSKTDGPLIAWWKEATEITTSGQAVIQYPFVMDLMDGAGHGVIVATDNLYLSVGSATTGASNIVYAWILYRWKNVALPEYIGIVQSQQ